MFEALDDLNDRLNREALRVRRPKDVIFFCGGWISSDESEKSSPSLRDYLCRIRNIQKSLNAQIVLAEDAQQLYRDTNYPDLISFEEDIARVASIILVITESAGSLAELGAFSSEGVIREALRIIISDEHFAQESFVRWGPVKRVEDLSRERIGTFPWRTHSKTGKIIKSSINGHIGDIANFINDQTEKIDKSHRYDIIPDRQIFFDLIWLLHLFEAAPPEPLYEAVRKIHPEASNEYIKDKLFTLRTCKWVGIFSYSGRDFYYLPQSIDPYEYAYAPGQRVRDIDASKIAISTEFRDAISLSKNILKRLSEERGKFE
ncbi:retron St85 family effector protein [Erythrobacter sp.]|jgi:hypothetical protein|uniref:retron St85 family effector protein n=1 Tax=Erythrobacter sp. TaxID=1042 RepID=UPI002E9F5CB5|nr:retron St85 family effector protein [Erythrobacter sp.]